MSEMGNETDPGSRDELFSTPEAVEERIESGGYPAVTGGSGRGVGSEQALPAPDIREPRKAEEKGHKVIGALMKYGLPIGVASSLLGGYLWQSRGEDQDPGDVNEAFNPPGGTESVAGVADRTPTPGTVEIDPATNTAIVYEDATETPVEPSPTVTSSPTATENSPDPTEAPTQMPYSELTPEQMKEEVANNIEVFMNEPAEDLVALGERFEYKIAHPGAKGLVNAPLFNFGGNTPDQFLGKEGDYTQSFPSLGIIDMPKISGDVNGDFGYSFDMNGIYLGRTEHAMQTSVGKTTIDIAYFGVYIGDPASGDVFRTVIPNFLGWREEGKEDIVRAPASFSEKKSDNPIMVPLKYGAVKTESEIIEGLDQHVMDGVTDFQLGFLEIPDEEYTVPDNLPKEFYTVEYKRTTLEDHKDCYEALRDITLIIAENDGYSSYSLNGSDRDPTPNDISQYVAGESIKDLSDKLPEYEDLLGEEPLTVDRLMHVLWGGVVNVHFLTPSGIQ